MSTLKVVVEHMKESEKIMFEVYREVGYNRKYKVVYFTELNEHNKETEINRAMAGDHFFDGFLAEKKKEEAKAVIDRLLERLNEGDRLRPEDLQSELAEYLV
jgi:hypothetical protein